MYTISTCYVDSVHLMETTLQKSNLGPLVPWHQGCCLHVWHSICDFC